MSAKIQLNPQSNTLGCRENALMYAAIGLRVFPVHEISDGICSCGKSNQCDRPGKHPRTLNGLKDASSDRTQIEVWWKQWPNASVGLATGKESNLTVIDADASAGKAGVINLTQLCAQQGGLPATCTVDTGGGGLHLYFTYCPELKTGSNVLGEAIDVRNDGGYVIAPPSTHISGKKYQWANIRDVLLDVPEWLMRAPEQPTRRRGRRRVSAGHPLTSVEQMLRHIDPDDRDRWLSVGIIMGRLYVGVGAVEVDAWSMYERWAARSDKFDLDRAANLSRMREAFYERSQETPRAGAAALTLGSLINWAREGGWTPFGARAPIHWDSNNEADMCEQVVATIHDEAIIDENNFFNINADLREVVYAQVSIPKIIKASKDKGEDVPEMLYVRPSGLHSLIAFCNRYVVLETVNREGVPSAQIISERLAQLIMHGNLAGFRSLAGIAEWPMCDSDGDLIFREKGYDEEHQLYFHIGANIKIDEKLQPEAAWRWLRVELFGDFPFVSAMDEAKALALGMSYVQRPLLRTCPAFAIVAPQPKTGKTTLAEAISMGVRGAPVITHPWSQDPEEIRKAYHALILSKTPAVLFDNISRGETIESNETSRLLTSPEHADRTLGKSITQKEANQLLIIFTGNNINFIRDMADRVLTINLNAKSDDPMMREWRHPDILDWAASERSKILSCLISIISAGIRGKKIKIKQSRFSDFDAEIVKGVKLATGLDINESQTTNIADTEENAARFAYLQTIGHWQEKRQGINNGNPWKNSDLTNAVQKGVFSEDEKKILLQMINKKLWEDNPRKAMGYVLRSMNGDYTNAPLILEAVGKDKHDESVLWKIKGWELSDKGDKSF